MIANLYRKRYTVYPQPSFLPILDYITVFTPVKLLGHFAQNCRLRVSAKPPVDGRCLVTDPQFRQEVATAVRRHLRANPPGDSNVDDVEATFAVAIMRTAELVIPPQERRRPGRGWSGDAQTEAELQTVTDAMHAACQRLKTDTRDAQLRRAVKKSCNGLKRVRSAAVVRFFEHHIVKLEKQLRMVDQHGFFQNIKSVQLEETKKVESQCVRDEGGRLLRDKGRIRERWIQLFSSLLNSKSDMLDLDIPKMLPQQPVASALGIEPTVEEIATAMKATANAKAVGPDGFPAELLKFGLQQDRTILLELHRLTTLIWREGKVPRGKTRSLPYSTRRATRQSAETTAASRSCRTQVRFSLKWLPGGSALTVGRRDCYRRSSAGFDRIARPRTRCLWCAGCRKLGERQQCLSSCAL